MIRPKWFVTACLVILVVTGCGQKQVIQDVGRAPHPGEASLQANEVEQQLRAAAARWRGTPHRMGGSDRRGVDCSGLVQQMYRDLFGIQLPRTARQQSGRGLRVKRSELKPGDLVFFNPPGKLDHVGIYLGRGDFVHTSSKKGVTVSRIRSSYWKKHYWTARRILPL